MKSFFYVAFITLFSFCSYSQNNDQQQIAESTKALAKKISQEMNFDENETIYLYRALYSSERTRSKVKYEFSDNSEQLEAANKKIDLTFYKMLTAKFSESEIAKIKQLVEIK